jgi:Carboxypeptidase regulatory-like domain
MARLSWFFLCVLPVCAQYEQGAFRGAIHDPQHLPVPNAQVELTHDATGLVRPTQTNSEGLFSVPGLRLGSYTVSVAAPGFARVVLKDVRLSVGETRTLEVTLQLAPHESNQVPVAVHLSELDLTSAAVATRIHNEQIARLPLNGRNWASLLPLAAGAIDPGTSDQRSVRFAGHGRDDNNFTLDGVDAGGISNQPQKSQIRLAIPTSSIAEFKVDATLFPAETGVGSGAQVVLASLAGTNAFHGSAFEFLRNDVLDARNPFALQKQPFRLNQFGADFSGPLIRNRTFFFASFEALRQRLDQALQGFTPSASYRTALLAQSAALAPLINAFPAGTLLQASDPTTDLFIGLSPQRANETSGMIRFDHRLSDSTAAFFRINVDESVTDNPLGNLRDRTVADARPINAVLALNQAVSPSLVNEARLGFNQVNYRSLQSTPLPYSLRVTGFTAVSSSRTREEDDTSTAVVDNVTWARGRHIFKAGAEIRRVLTNPGSSADGSLTYTSRANFTANILDSASVTSTLPLKRLRKTQVFSFIQDEYRLRPNFTVNIGLRYSFFNVFHEAQGRAVPFDFATCGGLCAQGAPFSDPRLADLDPRVSFAWSPTGTGQTVVRAGFGIYHGDGQLEDQNLPASNDVASYSLNSRQIPGLVYPIAPFLSTVPGILSPRAQDRNRHDEYASQWGLSVQHQLPSAFVTIIGYLGNKGTNLQTITYANVADPITGNAPYPQYGQVQYRTNDSNSNFHALQLSLQRRMTSGVLLSTNYMWSHAINDGSLGGGETDATTPENVFCRACERASSASDVRQFFSMNGIYAIPYRARFLKPLLRGWSLSGAASARSGLPVNITVSRAASAVPGGYNLTQRPDLVPGVSLTPPGGSTAAGWLNPAAFAVPAPGTWGNAGRNLARGPSLYQIDLSVARSVPLGERLHLELRAEAFNALNRTQLGNPTGDITVPAQFGIIQGTINTTPIGSGTPRQIQFLLRVGW